MRRDRLSRGGIVLLLALAIAAVLALRAAATGTGGEPTDHLPIGGPPPEKLHPTIVDWLARRPAEERERVIVTFRPDVTLPESELTKRHGARVIETFWINNSALVELPLGAIPAIAARSDVTYVQPEEGGEPPPG